MVAADDLDQRRFARAVLAENRVDLPCPKSRLIPSRTVTPSKDLVMFRRLSTVSFILPQAFTDDLGANSGIGAQTRCVLEWPYFFCASSWPSM